MHNLCVNKIIYLLLLTLNLPASDMQSLLPGGGDYIPAGGVLVIFFQGIP